MFVLIWRQNLQCFGKIFYLLFDNSQAWRLSTGRFWYWNFPFACVNSFGKSGRQTGAETSSCRTSENHVCCGQRGAIRTFLHWDWRILFRIDEISIVGEMHKHEDCSSSWKMHLSQRLDCPELGTHKVEVCDWNASQTDPDWVVVQLENWIRYRLIQIPLCFDYFVDSQ